MSSVPCAIASDEKLGLDQVKSDLEHTAGIRVVGGAPGVTEMAWEWVRMKEGQAMLPAAKRVGSRGESSFIADSRIDELRKLPSPDFDFQKLIRLCEELNSSYDNGNLYATAMLTRGVLDQVPPVFGHTTFALLKHPSGLLQSCGSVFGMVRGQGIARPRQH
jgi:hypothetical protein